MTRMYRDGEAWTREEGAPEGPSIDVVIPSSREGHGPYRITVDHVSGVILHQPPCSSWVHRGPGLCRHVREARYRAEQVGATFLADVGQMIAESEWWASPDCPAKDLVAAIVRRRDEARNQAESNGDYEAFVSRPPVSAEELAEFVREQNVPAGIEHPGPRR